MKRTVDVTESEAARQFAALRNIAERFRNTYSHGAFDPGAKAAMSAQSGRHLER